MRKTIILAIMLITALSTLAATKVEMLYVKNVLISPCNSQRIGCSPKIKIDGKNYEVEIISSAVMFHLPELLTGDYGDQQLCSDVVGFIVKERGRMPNPMYEFEVFKVTSMVRSKTECENL